MAFGSIRRENPPIRILHTPVHAVLLVSPLLQAGITAAASSVAEAASLVVGITTTG